MILIPWLCLLYLVCFLDRTNIGNAKIAHLTTDIPMDTTHYNLTLTIFFISYSVFEALANILLKRFRPSVFLPMTMYVVCYSPYLEYKVDNIAGYSGVSP